VEQAIGKPAGLRWMGNAKDSSISAILGNLRIARNLLFAFSGVLFVLAQKCAN
jgi:hypothetical protein